jgi:hypothetical protein
MEAKQKPNAQLRSAVRGFYAWIGSMALLVLAPLAAMRLIDSASTTARISAVILGAGAGLPWMWVVYSIIRRSDEFMRRLQLIALGIAFGGTVLLLATLDWLVRASFIERPAPIVVMGGALVIWLVALLGANFYFGRER